MLWDKHTPLRLLGISLTNPSRYGEAQISLFNEGDRERSRMIYKAVDAIRGEYGADVIQRGSEMESSARVGRKYKAQMDND